MQKSIIILMLFLSNVIFVIGCSDVDQSLTKDEQAIYTMIIDSVYNDTYKIIHINDSTHSLLRYTIKNIFSETLFDKDPEEYYKSFFKQKKCNINDDLIETFVKNNRKQYYLAENYQPNRFHKFVNYKSIYYYLRSKNNYKNKFAREIRDDQKFGLISLSRAGFNKEHSEALIEVNIHRKQLKEIFYCHMIKVKEKWIFDSNCYMYGPYRIK